MQPSDKMVVPKSYLYAAQDLFSAAVQNLEEMVKQTKEKQDDGWPIPMDTAMALTRLQIEVGALALDIHRSQHATR